ncbi:MAG: ATP-dependent Clp protease ATP-binding subunit, partial [Firmicutes bacterium]|nr:ATP-dependent Clp protease ATP-binding subunit [Bacillota bacterium]
LKKSGSGSAENTSKEEKPNAPSVDSSAAGEASKKIGNEKSKLPAVLLEIGTDLTLKARENRIDPIIGRDKETERIIEVLCRKTKNNPILIGEAGVGKTAVVEGLALAIANGEVPDILKSKEIYSLEIGNLMAGTKYRGTLEEKLKTVIETIQKEKNIIVFIDEIHTLAAAGSNSGEVNPADMLKPYLSRGELQTIGATTTDEYKKFIEKNKALERRFQPIMVNPPSVEETILILKGIRDSYEAFHKVKITDEAIVAAATLSDRYIMDRNLPDKAIDLIDEAASRAKVLSSNEPSDVREFKRQIKKLEMEKEEAMISENFEKISSLTYEINKLKEKLQARENDILAIKQQGDGSIHEEDIARVVASWTGIPVGRLGESEKERLVKLEEILHKRVIGQKEAVSAVSRAIRRARAGLKDEKKPIGSFLFLGPTGVGKTELSKAISEAMFDSEDSIIRLDMSEYMEAHSVAKLIGAPPGYVGHEDGGQLTEQVRRKQYSVVLFDELEKAHNDVFNILLQILDEGRLSDSQGRVVSFKNTIIILTSNVGAELFATKKSLGFGENPAKEDNRREVFMEAVKKKFKPEFINRIDEIVIFDKLTIEDIAQIANITLKKLSKRLEDKNIKLKISDKALRHIVKEGYSEEYGARPIKRLIQSQIEDKLAEALLVGSVKDVSELTLIEEGGKLFFK